MVDWRKLETAKTTMLRVLSVVALALAVAAAAHDDAAPCDCANDVVSLEEEIAQLREDMGMVRGVLAARLKHQREREDVASSEEDGGSSPWSQSAGGTRKLQTSANFTAIAMQVRDARG
jgi:hypothetical protein